MVQPVPTVETTGYHQNRFLTGPGPDQDLKRQVDAVFSGPGPVF